ncbi:MAG: hypothetical protein NC928_03745 [Candidatus Omnitrophica bacterium]|nr:hypothetical protein [Candidatus Omnitrophota bacterium]
MLKKIKAKKEIGFFLFFIFGLINLSWGIEFPSISKSKIRLSIPAGKSNYGEIIVENPTDKYVSLRLYLEDWYYLPTADGSKKFVPINTTPFSCASWINFSPAEFTLPPFGRQRVSYVVKVPSYAQGGYYAALFFETAVGKPADTEGGLGVGISLALRVATLFYIEVEGTIKKAVSLENLLLKSKPKDKILEISLDFKNTGNVDITAGGSYHIMDKEGVIYVRGEFNDVYTFPADSAKFTATWKEPIPKGKYDLVLTIDIGKAQEELGLGRGPVITKEAEIEIGENGEVLRVGELR